MRKFVYLDTLCTLIPYRRTLCIADNMVESNEKYFALTQIGIGLNQIILSFLRQQSTLNIFRPIVMYYA